MHDPEYETFVVYVMRLNFATLSSSSPLNVYPSYKPQIIGFIAKKALTNVPVKYANFADMFFMDLTSKLPNYTKIHNHSIKLVNANGFNRLSKSRIDAFIFFDRKSDGSFWLYVNYRGLNNFIIKNWYSLPLVGESLDKLKRAR